MSQPLAGIRILELGNFIAGPFCTMLLADMGADVIKIEPPAGGDMARATPPYVDGMSAQFASLNRNKRSLALDLKRPQARETVLRLAQAADVFLENYRPGVMEKMGLGAEQVRKLNPRIVYVSVSGFGQTGPDRQRAAVNLIIEAASGSLSVTGEPDQMPMRPGLQTGDVLGAMYAVYATLTGLVSAARHGEGNVADVSLVEASIASAMLETGEYLATGKPPKAMGRRHRLAAPYQLFATRDGRYLAIGSPTNKVFELLMRCLGLQEHLADPRFANYGSRKANEGAIVALIEAAVATRGSSELEKALVSAGVPCAMVRNYQDVFDDPQIVERKMLVDAPRPGGGTRRSVRNPILLDHDGPSIRRPPPLLGEHSQEILAEAGYTGAEIEAFARDGITLLGERAAAAA